MEAKGFLITGKKEECFGCEACIQVCSHGALKLMEDAEGFRYPVLDTHKCVDCNLCHKVCPVESTPKKYNETQEAFGGYSQNEFIRDASTSGGAFSEIVNIWCDENYVIFGAVTEQLSVHHSFVLDKAFVSAFRKSKYSQSNVRGSYKEAARFLREGKKVVFSGTPCQTGGLKKYLDIFKTDTENLLTVEVVCEGVPSPLYIRKFNKWVNEKYGSRIFNLDYRYKDGHKWDFQVGKCVLENGKELKIDRWFNPFWSIWLNHLMTRPSCYSCPFTTRQRLADITLGDLWGVHLYCPELYGRNGGSSLIVANSDKGKKVLKSLKSKMYGHEIELDTAIKYQGPMRRPIPVNHQRDEFMRELKDSGVPFKELNRKWAKRPTLKLLWQKYVWGNRQKVAFWELTHRLFRK